MQLGIHTHTEAVATLVMQAVGLQGSEGLPGSRLHLPSQARENAQRTSSTSKWLMSGGNWCFIVQYNRIAQLNTIKGRQPYPCNINLAGLWSTWGLLHETPWPGEGRGFLLHLLTLGRAAASIGSPHYSHLAGSPASCLSLRYPWNYLRILTLESWMLL